MAKQSLNIRNGRDSWQNTIRIKGPILCPTVFNQCPREDGEEADGVYVNVIAKSKSAEEVTFTVSVPLESYWGVFDDTPQRTDSNYVLKIFYRGLAYTTVSFDVTVKYDFDFQYNIRDFNSCGQEKGENIKISKVTCSEPVFSNSEIGWYALDSSLGQYGYQPEYNAGDFTTSFNPSATIEVDETNVKVTTGHLCHDYPYTEPGGVQLPYPNEFDKRAEASIDFTDNTASEWADEESKKVISDGTTITLESLDGTSKTYTASPNPSPGSTEFNNSGTTRDLAISLRDAINSSAGHDGKLIAKISESLYFKLVGVKIEQRDVSRDEDNLGNTEISVSGNSITPPAATGRTSGISIAPHTFINNPDATIVMNNKNPTGSFEDGELSDWDEDGRSRNNEYMVNLKDEEHRPPTTGRMKGIYFDVSAMKAHHDLGFTITLKDSGGGPYDIGGVSSSLMNHAQNAGDGYNSRPYGKLQCSNPDTHPFGQLYAPSLPQQSNVELPSESNWGQAIGDPFTQAYITLDLEMNFYFSVSAAQYGFMTNPVNHEDVGVTRIKSNNILLNFPEKTMSLTPYDFYNAPDNNQYTLRAKAISRSVSGPGLGSDCSLGYGRNPLNGWLQDAAGSNDLISNPPQQIKLPEAEFNIEILENNMVGAGEEEGD